MKIRVIFVQDFLISTKVKPMRRKELFHLNCILDTGRFLIKFDTVQYGVFRLRRRHFLVKRADDGGAPKNEWNEEFEDIITDTTILLLTGSRNQF